MNTSPRHHTVFYSWQSDLANRTNRTFIEDALKKAIDGIPNTNLTLDVRFDSDTQNTPGAPDIFQTILSKIERATVFVGDVSIVNPGSTTRPTPNPNVLLELGYAVRCLSWTNILPIFNLATARIEDLPFDLRGRRPMTYRMAADVADRQIELRGLSQKLQGALELILSQEQQKTPEVRFVVQRSPLRFGVRNDGSVPITVEKFTLEYPQSIHGNPVRPFDQPPLVRVQSDQDVEGTPVWRMTLIRTEAPLAPGYYDDWRLPPVIEPKETEIFEHPVAVIKEAAPRDSKLRLKVSLSEGNPIEVITSFGELLDPNGAFSI